ncbi:MalY/PatB family protein [Lacticaseibacillus baoqingensis]|uniref:cysteine-S-conjugate beta-lyase n=1 Tax=Lacticaseibacillus baoqingensis TaxID=2486013 RepID=A0ABW4E847_9LACO|nr:PatB family C-S lyase [Lacticaseibacillus baoqingensis]
MYDFTTVHDRRNSDSVKWAGTQDELPMWIADMDFQTAPEIIAAMQRKVATGIFGYETPPAEFYAAISAWYAQEHHARLPQAWQLYTTGVMPALAALIREFTQPGEQIAVTAPVYHMFYQAIEAAGRQVISADLSYSPITHTYALDFEALAQVLAAPTTTMMILCNPHNPIGRIWSRNELLQIAQLCAANDVLLIADEIHGDLRLTDRDYTPAFTLPDLLQKRLITLLSPGKTFNVAALHTGVAVVSDAPLRARVAHALAIHQVDGPNLLAIPAVIAAYTKGHAWLAALRQQLQANLRTVQTTIAEIPGLACTPLEATYLMWLDVSAMTDDASDLCAFLQANVGLRLSPGAQFRGNGQTFIRMNIACPPALLTTALARLHRGLALYRR